MKFRRVFFENYFPRYVIGITLSISVFSCSVLLLLSLVLLPLYAFASARVGGWRPLSNVKDPHVVEIGEFAVSEYDRQIKSGLKFVAVVSGESQVAAGANYRLIVTVDGGVGVARADASKKYEAIVWEKPWLKSMNLTSFKPVV